MVRAARGTLLGPGHTGRGDDVLLASGPSFAPEGGLDRFVRVPYTQPAHVLTDAVARLGRAWADTLADPGHLAGSSPRWWPEPYSLRSTPRTVSASMASADLLEHLGADVGVDESARPAPRRPSASRETCMPAMLTPASPRIRPTSADHAGAVGVAEERQVLGGRQVDVEAVDLDDLLGAAAGPTSVPETETDCAVGQGAAHGDQVAVVRADSGR